MPGDERVRHCSDCNLNVYNSIGLTADELTSLVTEREGRLCMRLYKRADGSVVTSDCREARALGVRERVVQLRSEFTVHHVAHAGFIFVLTTFLGPLGALLWLALVLACRYRQWAPQTVQLICSPGSRRFSRQEGQTWLAHVARLPPMRFVGSVGAIYGLMLASVIGASVFIGMVSVLSGLGQLLLEGSIGDLFSSADAPLGGIDTTIR